MQYPPLLQPFYEAKGIMAQVWQRWFNEASTAMRLINRSDITGLSVYDFQLADLVTDGNWNDLNLASIIPKGTKAVKLRVRMTDDALSELAFRKNGYTGTLNSVRMLVQVAGAFIEGDLTVFCGEDRIIEYNATNTVWTVIAIVVQGWWL